MQVPKSIHRGSFLHFLLTNLPTLDQPAGVCAGRSHRRATRQRSQHQRNGLQHAVPQRSDHRLRLVRTLCCQAAPPSISRPAVRRGQWPHRWQGAAPGGFCGLARYAILLFPGCAVSHCRWHSHRLTAAKPKFASTASLFGHCSVCCGAHVQRQPAAFIVATDCRVIDFGFCALQCRKVGGSNRTASVACAPTCGTPPSVPATASHRCPWQYCLPPHTVFAQLLCVLSLSNVINANPSL